MDNATGPERQNDTQYGYSLVSTRGYSGARMCMS